MDEYDKLQNSVKGLYRRRKPMCKYMLETQSSLCHKSKWKPDDKLSICMNTSIDYVDQICNIFICKYMCVCVLMRLNIQ